VEKNDFEIKRLVRFLDELAMLTREAGLLLKNDHASPEELTATIEKLKALNREIREFSA
jgi:hypothetical protein